MRRLQLLLLIPLLFTFFCQGQSNCDILIKNGKIIDGTGNSWYYGDIAVKGEN